MGNKKLQGADGINFQLQLTIKGLESINLPEENLKNESGNDIMKISCWGGKLSAYVNLPNAIRPNNVQPFQLSDCIKIELVRNQVIEHMRSYLQKHLKDKYSDEFLSMMSVTKMECNLTIKCVLDYLRGLLQRLLFIKKPTQTEKHIRNQNEESQQPSPMNGC